MSHAVMSFCNVTCRYVILLKAFETWIIVLCNFLASHVTVSHFFSSLFLYHFHFLSNRWSRLLNKNNKKESESRNEIFFTRNVKRVLNPLYCRRRRCTNSWDGNVKTTSSFRTINFVAFLILSKDSNKSYLALSKVCWFSHL